MERRTEARLRLTTHHADDEKNNLNEQKEDGGVRVHALQRGCEFTWDPIEGQRLSAREQQEAGPVCAVGVDSFVDLVDAGDWGSSRKRYDSRGGLAIYWKWVEPSAGSLSNTPPISRQTL